jgi:hypothetical protein
LLLLLDKEAQAALPLSVIGSISGECGNRAHDYPSAILFPLPPFHGLVKFFLYEDFPFGDC